MPRRRRNPEVIAILEGLLAAARRGEVTDVACLARNFEGCWFEEYETGDIADMVFELRSMVIRIQCPPPSVPRIPN